jgi:sulfotransferase family protein
MAKIFGIGLSRSGTSSLTEALRILGFSAIHSPTTLSQIRRHDAATDTTVADNFERLDEFFPGSKFIHTFRSKERWLQSCERFWLLMQPRFDASFLLTELHKQLYGSPTFDRQAFSTAYDRHALRVERFFAARPHDLLQLPFEDSANLWEPICRFLGREVPQQAFPRSHGMRVIESCVGRLRAHFNDVDVVARLVNTSPAFVESVHLEGAEQQALSPEGSQFVEEVAVRTCRELGSVAKTAKVLGVPRRYVQNAVASHKPATGWFERAKTWLP